MRFVPATIPQPVYYSVNIDARELDFTTLGAADVKWLMEKGYLKDQITAESVPQALEAMTGGIELWAPLGFLVVALLLVEVAMARGLAREAEIQPERGRIEAALLDSAGRLAARVKRGPAT